MDDKITKGKRMRMIMGEAMVNHDVFLMDGISKLIGFDSEVKEVERDINELIDRILHEHERCTRDDNYIGTKWNKYIKNSNEIIVKRLKTSFPLVYSIIRYNEGCSVVSNLIRIVIVDIFFNVIGLNTKSKVFLNYNEIDEKHVYNNMRKFVFENELPSRNVIMETFSGFIDKRQNFGMGFQLNENFFDCLLKNIQLKYDKLLSYYLLGHLAEENVIASKVLLSKRDVITIINILTNDILNIITNATDDGITMLSDTQMELHNVVKMSMQLCEEREKQEKELAALKTKYNEQKKQNEKLKELCNKAQNSSGITEQIAKLNKEIRQRNDDIEGLKDIIEKQRKEIERLSIIKEDNILPEELVIDPNIKILIAGGLPKTIAYIKELCPLSKAVTSETTPLNALEVDTFDMVLYFNDFSNHCITMRVKKYTDNDVKNVHIKQVYCYSTNKEQIKRTIYEAAKELGF